MSPTTAPNEGAQNPSRVDPAGEEARERANDMKAEILALPPEANPPLPFVTWRVPPKDLETL